MEGSLEASQGKSWFHQKIQMTFVWGGASWINLGSGGWGQIIVDCLRPGRM